MTSVCYFIVCVNLLYSFEQTEISSNLRNRSIYREISSWRYATPLRLQEEYFARRYCQYFDMPYDKQLKKKQNMCIFNLHILVTRSGFLKNLRRYTIYKIIPSPVTQEYRNKDEFYIRPGIDGNPKTVGCLIGKIKVGRGIVENKIAFHPTKIPTIKGSHKRVAQVYEDFIRLSHLEARTNINGPGYWCTLHVRSNQAGDVMTCVTVNPGNLTNITIYKQQETLKQYFFHHLKHITLYHQVCPRRRCSHDESPFTLLYGKPYLMETLYGYKFKISPHSLFPNNKLGAEVLYDHIIRRAKLTQNTTVLNICGRAGINSIIISKYVKEAVVITPFQEAVVEWKDVKQLNNIQNVKFLLGSDSENVNSLLEILNVTNDVVAIMSYSIKLLGMDIIQIIRASIKISRILYISYKPYSLKVVKTFVDLCSDNNSTAPPFVLTKVVPFDLLPYTSKVEYILVFQRESFKNI